MPHLYKRLDSQPAQELYEDGGETGPHKEELEGLLDAIDKLHIQVERPRLAHPSC